MKFATCLLPFALFSTAIAAGPVPPGGAGQITQAVEWNTPGTTLRWHLWITRPGTLFANTHLTTPPDHAGARLTYTLAGTTHAAATRAETAPEKPQGNPISFKVATTGWHTLQIKLGSLAGREVGDLHRIDLFGPAAGDARLLRARWRPAACHARFSSSTLDDPILWVMSTRPSPAAAVSSYSPVTTPFGYYGTSFNIEGLSSGTANFSHHLETLARHRRRLVFHGHGRHAPPPRPRHDDLPPRPPRKPPRPHLVIPDRHLHDRALSSPGTIG
jgi:hypothetical protein